MGFKSSTPIYLKVMWLLLVTWKGGKKKVFNPAIGPTWKEIWI